MLSRAAAAPPPPPPPRFGPDVLAQCGPVRRLILSCCIDLLQLAVLKSCVWQARMLTMPRAPPGAMPAHLLPPHRDHPNCTLLTLPATRHWLAGTPWTLRSEWRRRLRPTRLLGSQPRSSSFWTAWGSLRVSSQRQRAAPQAQPLPPLPPAAACLGPPARTRLARLLFMLLRRAFSLLGACLQWLQHSLLSPCSILPLRRCSLQPGCRCAGPHRLAISPQRHAPACLEPGRHGRAAWLSAQPCCCLQTR